MDTNSLSYHYEEHFSVFEPENYESPYENVEDTFNLENAFNLTTNDNDWQWEVETELNGDVALIPMSSGLAMKYLSHSPPKEDFQKIMSDWQNFINVEVPDMEALSTNVLLSGDEGTESDANTFSTQSTPVEILTPDVDNSSNPIDSKPIYKYPQSTGKRIDMEAQCYITEEKQSVTIKNEQIDSDYDEPERVQLNNEPIDIVKNEINQDMFEIENREPPSTDNHNENDFVDVDTVPEFNIPILEAKDVNSLLEQFEATEGSIFSNEQKNVTTSIPETHTIKESNSNIQPIPETHNQIELNKSKQILNALPQELIMKIKASSKRKVVPVIEPIPNKRRGSKKLLPEIQIKTEKVNSEFVQREHDYCSLPTPYPKCPKKDSGFESAEEEEQRSILRNQPTFKGADGKLMVSLLKANTIRNNIAIDNTKKKRKLNLEEYKKRHEGIIRSCDTSQSNSPATSGRNSPAVLEDDQTRLLKHQQKLMKMAAEVLNTPPKSARKTEEPPIEHEVKSEIPNQDCLVTPPPLPSLPENVEVKTLVSIGVNTNVQIGMDVTKFEDIKSILESANGKISNNSLIASVLENIQTKKNIQTISNAVDQSCSPQAVQEHGEDKTIVYLDKSRKPVALNTVAVQTDMLEAIQKHRRRCDSNSNSNRHRKSYKWRSSSNDSSCSYSSQSSSTSRSRSPSPSSYKSYNKKRRSQMDEERLREVEERRIIYVGGISSGTTKQSLRRRFEKFGLINNVSVHIREHGENYGFVTFVHKSGAYEAVEHGNDDPTLPKYDLRFGGRRIFCGTNYSDLDNVQDDMNHQPLHMEDSFDNLLREVQAKIRKRKSCQ